jgi:hypothetical protein
MIGTLRRKPAADPATGLPRLAHPRRTKASPMSVLRPAGAGPVALKPTHSPWVRLIGAIFFAAFWNGIVSIFVWQVIDGFRHGRPSWFMTLFMIPFVVVGVGLLGMVLYQFLALFNPRPRLELSSSHIPLGGTAALNWSFLGRASRIRELSVMLRGVEEARYTRGTNTYTDRNTFYEMELFKTTSVGDMADGQVGFALPQGTMHSFDAENNKILWSLDLHGQIKYWPDVKESFKITVAPLPV